MKNGIEIVKQIYKLSEKLPKEEKFGLRSQITRAAISIPSKIAEGCSRNSEVEFKRFLEIALGSLLKIKTQLIIISELELIPSQKYRGYYDFNSKRRKND
ncbi:four helix bundle protein [Pontimicrobium sp. MEBiC06410]